MSCKLYITEDGDVILYIGFKRKNKIITLFNLVA